MSFVSDKSVVDLSIAHRFFCTKIDQNDVKSVVFTRWVSSVVAWISRSKLPIDISSCWPDHLLIKGTDLDFRVALALLLSTTGDSLSRRVLEMLVEDSQRKLRSLHSKHSTKWILYLLSRRRGYCHPYSGALWLKHTWENGRRCLAAAFPRYCEEHTIPWVSL